MAPSNKPRFITFLTHLLPYRSLNQRCLKAKRQFNSENNVFLNCMFTVMRTCDALSERSRKVDLDQIRYLTWTLFFSSRLMVLSKRNFWCDPSQCRLTYSHRREGTCASLEEEKEREESLEFCESISQVWRRPAEENGSEVSSSRDWRSDSSATDKQQSWSMKKPYSVVCRLTTCPEKGEISCSIV